MADKTISALDVPEPRYTLFNTTREVPAVSPGARVGRLMHRASVPPIGQVVPIPRTAAINKGI